MDNYLLENRLATHVKTTDVTASDEITIATTTYLYNHEGIKVRKTTEIVAENKATHEQTIVSTSSESYLIDAYNHTGYAQVLESVTDTGAVTSYTIGDDVLSQSSIYYSSFITHHFLPDGHGSTRQLTDSTGIITAQYSYDSYGLMLGTQSGSQPQALTSLLYCGEQFDSALQQYNLRARHYDPSNGRFNRVDPFSGSQYDPQSLHKYAYCHSDPVNNIDPSGEFTLLELIIAVAMISLLSGLTYTYIRNEIAENKLRKEASQQIFDATRQMGDIMSQYPDCVVDVRVKCEYDIPTASKRAAVEIKLYKKGMSMANSANLLSNLSFALNVGTSAAQLSQIQDNGDALVDAMVDFARNKDVVSYYTLGYQLMDLMSIIPGPGGSVGQGVVYVIFMAKSRSILE